jgi:lipoprotein-anchoring transpeptidase ErfK/SrfK
MNERHITRLVGLALGGLFALGLVLNALAFWLTALPDVEGGARNPMGARALDLYAGGKDTLYRIHGTNQPEHIGHAISSGCIRITNEDAIDLFGWR